MDTSLDAQIVAQIEQQCMLQARRECEALVEQQLGHAEAVIDQLGKDKTELHQLLVKQLQEVWHNMYVLADIITCSKKKPIITA